MTGDNVTPPDDGALPTTRYVNAAGEPIDNETWARLWNSQGYHGLAQTRAGRYRITTEWVGVDDPSRDIHPFTTHLQLIEETHVRWPNHAHYQTRQQALTGHARLVELLSANGLSEVVDE